MDGKRRREWGGAENPVAPPVNEKPDDPNFPKKYLAGGAPGDELFREATLAQLLHREIECGWPRPDTKLGAALGPFDMAAAPPGEPWDTMRKLLRRYPTAQDAEDVVTRLLEISMNAIKVASLERELEAVTDRTERRRIAKDIEALRRG